MRLVVLKNSGIEELQPQVAFQAAQNRARDAVGRAANVCGRQHRPVGVEVCPRGASDAMRGAACAVGKFEEVAVGGDGESWIDGKG